MTRKLDPWESALPPASAYDVVDFLVRTFHTLREEDPTTYHFGLGEIVLSNRLGVRLQNTQAADGLVCGYWHYENHTNRLDEGDPRRIDITFDTVRDNKDRVSFIFECKKMAAEGARAKRHRSAYLREGVRRFYQASYAPGEPFAFMIGFAEGNDRNAYVGTLKRLFATKDLDTTLGMTKQDGKYWREPPHYFAPHAALSTLHQRDMAPAGARPDIVIYHVPLMLDIWPPPQ